MTLVKDYLFKLGIFAAILLFILFSMDIGVSGKDYKGQYHFFCNFRHGNV